MTETRLRLVVADDHPALTVVLRTYLEARDCTVVATASDGRRAVAEVSTHAPDVVVVDYRMPYLEGAPLLSALKEAQPDALLVVYTAEADEDVWSNAAAAGAAALVLKEAPLGDLWRAIEAVLAGGSYLDAGVRINVAGRATSDGLRLTPRETDVLALLADGLSHDAIGARLNISSETVRTHVRKSSARLGASTRTEAVATALRLGLIS